MRKAFVDNRVEYRIADVRDKNAIYDVLDGVNYLFHAAALNKYQVGDATNRSSQNQHNRL